MNQEWDETVDILVAGSGIGGLGSAVIAAANGADVLVVEKAATLGGTTAKSAAYMWIPNNKYLRATGRTDPRDDALRYMAKLSRPRLYNPVHPTLGLPDWEYDGLTAFYDNASDAAEAYENFAGLKFGHASDFPDYYAHLPEDAAPTGRVLFPEESEGGPSGGSVLIETLARACERADVPIRTNARVVELIQDPAGAIIGAVVESAGRTAHIRTRRGVICATGGFTQDPELRLRFLDHSYVGGCAARTNTGDLLAIARDVGADLANLNVGMRAPMVLERLQRDPAAVRGSFMIPGDSMIIVNQQGSYPNNPLIAIWDEPARRFGGEGFGNPIPPQGEDDFWVIKADSFADLEKRIAERLETLREYTGPVELDTDFGTTLTETLDRWAAMAADGVDRDFGRGSTPIEQALSAYFGVGDGPNPMMAPLADHGPYYATILGPALIDTAGGPRVDRNCQVVRPDSTPIPGLYAVGNCAATPSGEAYWAGGHTIGFIQCAAYIAARHLTQH
jgi:succinate dehydrogenase/fumarate reductase flavoprotein subunit